MRPRRLVSLLIAGCMMVSMVPASAVTAFADTVSGTSVTASAGVTTYQELVGAIANAAAGSTVTLANDIDVKFTLAIKKPLTLDLNGHKLYNTTDLWDNNTEEQKNNWSLISVRENGDLTITGDGTLDAKENDCYAVDLQDESAKLTIENGTFIGNITAVYVHPGELTIKGGSFSIKQLNSNKVQDEHGVTINCRDQDYKDGTAKVTITGGTFDQFDPADNGAESGGKTGNGNGTNFCAPGYITKKNSDGTYTVRSRTYNVKTDTTVDETPNTTPDEETPDTPQEGTVGEPVKIEVAATGEDVEFIKTLTLDFGSDISAVGTVKIEKDGKDFVLSDNETYKKNEYKDMVIPGLFDDEPENGIATQAATADLSFDLFVTYTENGAHRVNIVFKDAEGDDGVVVSQKTAVAQIGPKSEDTGDDTPAGNNTGDGIGAVIAGVAIGTGAVVLAYHVGTELYAEQVLGQGVAVPKTRAEVALKAWELAGKPAVAAEGEPLSEAAQAERWVVESGLMQNEADGSFNGQKNMNKLMALRTLDAAKKLG